MNTSRTTATTLSRSALPQVGLLISVLKFMNQVLLFYWGVYFTQIELSGYQQGILLAMYPLVGMLSVIPIGFLNDRIPSKTMITLGFLLLSLQYFIVGQSEHFFLIALAFLLGSFGTVSTKLSLDSFFYKHSDRTKTHQVGSYVGNYLLAAGLGTLIGGTLLTTVSFHTLFQGVAIVAVLMAMVSRMLPAGPLLHLEFKEYRTDFLKPDVLLFISILFLWATHMGAEISSYGLFLRENLGLSYGKMGLYMGTAIMAMFAWSRLASRCMENHKNGFKILLWGLSLSAMGQIVMTVEWIPLSYFGRLIHEAGDAFMFVLFHQGIRHFFARERTGGSAGLVNFSEMSAITLSSLLFAPLGKMYGNELPLLIGAGCILLALPLGYTLTRKP